MTNRTESFFNSLWAHLQGELGLNLSDDDKREVTQAVAASNGKLVQGGVECEVALQTADTLLASTTEPIRQVGRYYRDRAAKGFALLKDPGTVPREALVRFAQMPDPMDAQGRAFSVTRPHFFL